MKNLLYLRSQAIQTVWVGDRLVGSLGIKQTTNKDNVIEAMVMLIWKQKKEISSFTEEVRSHKVLVQNMATAKKLNKKKRNM